MSVSQKKHPSKEVQIRYNIDEVKSLNDPSMPFADQRVELLALARLKHPEDKLLIKVALEKFKSLMAQVC